MVPEEGISSNQLFEVLEEWHEQLKHIDFDELNSKTHLKLEGEEPQP